MKKPRNYKIRIKNLNLKETFFLEYGESPAAVFAKYQTILRSYGYIKVISSPARAISSNTTSLPRTYIFYPKDRREKERKAYRKLHPVRSRFNSSGLRVRYGNPFATNISRNHEYDVTVEITYIGAK